MLLQRIYNTYAEGKVASLFLLDVSRVYDNVSWLRLFRDLRKRRINQIFVRWIDSFLRDRSSSLRLREYTASATLIQTGISQGSRLLFILYLFYNADVIEVCKIENIEVAGYVNDVSILIVSDLVVYNCKILKGLQGRVIGIIIWFLVCID